MFEKSVDIVEHMCDNKNRCSNTDDCEGGIAMINAVAHQGRKSHVKLSGLGRALVGLFLSLIIGLGFGLGRAAAAQDHAQDDTHPLEVYSYVVGPGDSLWKYAQMNAPQGEDLNDYIFYLMKLNHLNSTTLTVGQRIVVPKQG